MASPQCEDGYTRIANEIMEAVARTNLNAYQTRVLFAVIRLTYGWNKKEDWLPISQISKITMIHKCHVSRALAELKQRRIVTQRGNKIGFCKDYQLWSRLPNGVTPYRKVTQRGTTVTQRGNKKLPNRVDSKERKDISPKKENPLPPKIGVELSEYFLSKILSWKPDLKIPSNGQKEKWALEFARTVKLDKRDPARVRAVISFLAEDEFWRTVVLSANKFRKQFDVLEAKMRTKEAYI